MSPHNKGETLFLEFLTPMEGERDFGNEKQAGRGKCKHGANCIQLPCCTSEALPKNLGLFWVN